MPQKGHTEEQIVAVLGRWKQRARVAEICRKVRISPGDLLPLEMAARSEERGVRLGFLPAGKAVQNANAVAFRCGGEQAA